MYRDCESLLLYSEVTSKFYVRLKKNVVKRNTALARRYNISLWHNGFTTSEELKYLL